VAHPGTYFDGEAAFAQAVEVSFEAKELVIAREGRGLARWRYRTLYLVDSGAHVGVRLGSRRAGEARLVLESMAAIAELRRHAPHLFPRGGALRFLRRAALFAGASVALVAGAYFSLPYLAEALVPFVPHKIERQIGERVHRAFTQGFGACQSEGDKPGLAVLDRLTQRLLATVDTPYAITVEVSRMKLENAFALPGGIVVMTHKLIAIMESPDELAGVLAHEIGHVVERHAVIGMVESAGLSLATTVLLGGGSSSGEWIVNTASTLASLSYSRRLEARADERGIAMLESAGISPLGLAALFQRLERREAKADQSNDEKEKEEPKTERESEDSLSVFLSSHPPSVQRVARAKSSALINAPPALTAEEWAAVKAICGEAETQAAPAKKAP
jgi:Zn-dependent protease with chaperone function